ncbi:MAG: glutamate--tRNA ligase [Propionibacteriaceae bacterium]
MTEQAAASADTAYGPVRVRLAPSPTGDPHVGTAYQALYNLGYVRQQGGQFLLRVEDTDQARFHGDSEQRIFQMLHWLDLSWDEGPDIGGPCAPYRQSERLEIYRPYIDRLLDAGHAYFCWCSKVRLTEMREQQQRAKTPTGYDRLCYGKTSEERAELPGFTDRPVVRMLIPDDVSLSFTDLIRGEVRAPRPDDQVICKADGFPTYHLAVVVDDHEMGITTVVRGEEWISSTPKHLLLYRWLGIEPPSFAHLPLLRNTDRSKLGKRKNSPWASLTWFFEQGYLPEALVNFLCLMAYSPAIDADGNDVEVFDFADFSAGFSWKKVNPVGPIFDLKKLDWLNGVYIRKLDLADLTARLVPVLIRAGVLPEVPTQDQLLALAKITALIQTRMAHLTEAEALCRPFFVDDADLEVGDDARGQLGEGAAAVLDAASAVLAPAADWQAAEIQATLRATLVDSLGLKPKVAFGPLRVAVSGQRISPPLFESMEILGRDSTLARLHSLRAALG